MVANNSGNNPVDDEGVGARALKRRRTGAAKSSVSQLVLLATCLSAALLAISFGAQSNYRKTQPASKAQPLSQHQEQANDPDGKILPARDAAPSGLSLSPTALSAPAHAPATSYSIHPLNYIFTVSVEAGRDAIDGRPCIAFDGTNFFTAWKDPRNSATSATDVYGTFITRDGTILNPAGLPISTGAGDDYLPSIAFDGTNYVLIWVSETPAGSGSTEIYGARVTPNGAVLDTPAVKITTGAAPKIRPISLAFDGTNFLIIWRDGGDQIRGLRISRSLAPQDAPNGFVIGNGFYPWVAFNGTNYLVVWHGHGANDLDVFGALVDKNATALPPGVITINADPNDQDHTSVASDGTDFLVAWHDWRGTNEYGNGSAYVARVSAAGVVLDNPSIKIADHTLWQAPVEAVYDGDNYFVVWHVESTANFRISDNYGRRVSSGGVVLDQQSIPAATSFAHQFNPSLGYGDNRYLVLWNATGGCVNESSCIKAQMLEKVTPELPSSQNAPTAKTSSSNKVSPAQASSVWTAEASNTGYMLHNVWAFDESHVYVSTEADDGTVLKYDGSDWSVLAMIPTSRKFGLWGMGPLNLWSVGHCWNISHYDGVTIEQTTCNQDSQTGAYPMGEGIWGASAANIFSVGVFGGIIQYNGTNWVKTPSGVPQDLWDVWGTSPANVYAVGEFGTIIKYNGSSWTKQPNIPTIQSLNAIWGSGANDIFAVGDNGAIIHYNGASWTAQPTMTTENLYGVWGWSGTSVYAVGAYGTILHYDGTSWTQEASGTSVVLLDVGGAANTVRAVGDHGVILKKTEKDCTGTINPSSNNFNGNGGTGSLSVTAAANCNWTAVSNDSWLTVTSSASGAGNAAVNYSVAPNLETGSRTGTLTIAGQTFAVTQTPTPADIHFSESVYSVNEGAGSRQITVERTGNMSGTVTVNYATSDGTAQTPPDYLFNAGTLTFGPGETVKSFDVVIFNDSLDEPDETLDLTLSNPTGLATLGTPNAATLVIQDNDPPTAITIDDVNLFEGNAGATSLVFSIDLLQVSGQTVTVNFNTADGTALSGSDYQSQSGTLTFNPGDLRKTVTVQVSGDTLNEANETFFINLSNPANATISKGQGSGIINNDDAPPSVTISDVNVIEGDTGTTAAVFNVGLSTLSGQIVGVDFASSDGSANSNSDFIPNAGHLNFNPGETIKTITVLVNGDTQTEPDENFFVTLTNPINLTIAHSQAVGTIVNDDASLQFNATGYNASEGAGFIQINVTRNGNSAKDVSVNYNATDGSAQQRTDYTIAAGTLHFAAGENTKSFIILIVDDAYVEGPETINLSLSNPSGAGAGVPANATLIITDNDALPPTANPIDVAQDFVTMHYYDFLNRVPDAGGLGYWTDQITQCGSDAHCVHERRIGVSAAYFIELEFQETGYVVYRLYRAAFGARPAYDKFMPDRAQLVGGPGLPASTLEFANRFVLRPDFLNAYPSNTTPEQFVNRLFDTAGLVPYTQERQQEINAMKGVVGRTRAQVLLDVIEIAEFKTREYNPAFVLMQYFGYLRRDPDEGGYLFWLNVLNNREPNNYRGMVCSFITSQEYQERFSPISTRSNRDCQ